MWAGQSGVQGEKMIKEAQMDLLEILGKLFCGGQASHWCGDPGGQVESGGHEEQMQGSRFLGSSLKQRKELSTSVSTEILFQ